MKTKSINDIRAQVDRIMANGAISYKRQRAAQVARINGALAAKKMTEEEEHRFYKVAETGRRYSANALYYLKKQMGPADLDEYGAITSVPVSIYAK